jgi:acyl carrier protein
VSESLQEVSEGNEISEFSVRPELPGEPTLHELELAQLIVATLNLEVTAADIDPGAPIYGEGLGLDSIDILELALAITKVYGVQLRSEDENNRKIFVSLRRLNAHIQEYRTK